MLRQALVESLEEPWFIVLLLGTLTETELGDGTIICIRFSTQIGTEDRTDDISNASLNFLLNLPQFLFLKLWYHIQVLLLSSSSSTLTLTSIVQLTGLYHEIFCCQRQTTVLDYQTAKMFFGRQWTNVNLFSAESHPIGNSIKGKHAL